MMKQSRRTLLMRLIIWLFAGSLLVAALRQTSVKDVQTVLQSLKWWGVLFLLMANGVILLIKYVRWWIILRYQQHNVPLGSVAAIRHAAFVVSIITPGPMVGGEPFQVLALADRHQVPSDDAIASVTLDRMVEFSVSFTAIFAGGVFILQSLFGLSPLLLTIVGAVLMLPAVYLVTLRRNIHPLSLMVQRIPRLRHGVSASERAMSHFLQGNDRRLPVIFGLSAAGFVAQLGEFVLMLWLLGLSETLGAYVTLYIIIRFSLFMPTPGGLGAVESGQVLAFSMLGLNPAIAISLTILIRLRDICVILPGLWLANRMGRTETDEQ